MPRMSTSSRRFSREPEILYEFIWARDLYRSISSIAGALNLPTTGGILTLCRVNTESRRILTIWSDWARTRERPKRFRINSLWLYAHDGDYEDVMAAPAAPQIGLQNGTREIPHFVFTNWCIIQLMRVAPTRFPHCNFDTSPPELDAYDFFHVFTILRWEHTVLSLRENPSPKVRPASPVMWHRKPEVPTLPDSANTLEPRNALSATSGGDNICFPRERALSDCLGAREMLYQFAGKLCEQFQHVRLSVESGQAEKNKEANIQFPGIDGLVERYANTNGATSGPTRPTVRLLYSSPATVLKWETRALGRQAVEKRLALTKTLALE
ncbi:hypothetical protein N7465_008381 [Penicillium sp. CMV-2018d]|nr:hypothetical protein N7465_008381 [Penicillium sp. CMV-2018d]